MDNEIRRIRTRFAYSAHALIKSSSNGVIKGILRDVSVDSMYLYCKHNFNINDKVHVEIILLGKGSELIIRLTAHVKRIDQSGVALGFTHPLEWWPVFSHFPFHDLKKETVEAT